MCIKKNDLLRFVTTNLRSGLFVIGNLKNVVRAVFSGVTFDFCRLEVFPMVAHSSSFDNLIWLDAANSTHQAIQLRGIQTESYVHHCQTRGCRLYALSGLTILGRHWQPLWEADGSTTKWTEYMRSLVTSGF